MFSFCVLRVCLKNAVVAVDSFLSMVCRSEDVLVVVVAVEVTGDVGERELRVVLL